jgi:hypothetical protein
MSIKKTPAIWPQTAQLDGYILRSIDVSNRKVGDVPRILGIHAAAYSAMAVYALRQLDPHTLSTISIVGFNNDRDPRDPSSFVRPPLPSGVGNVMKPTADLVAECRALYTQGGFFLKFKFAPPIPPGRPADAFIAELVRKSDSTAMKHFPIGAGIREYVLHRPVAFRLVGTYDLKQDMHYNLSLK